MGGTLNGRMLNAGRMINPDDLKQLAPTGKLRGGVVVSPAASVFFAIKDGKGEVRGVTLDLLRAFAETLKLPLVLQVYDNSGQVTDAVASAACDLAFMPQDAERAKKVDFGPAYYFISSTYLVPAGSKIQSIDEVNRPGVRIVAISNTTTARVAGAFPTNGDRGGGAEGPPGGAQARQRSARRCQEIRPGAPCA